MNLTEFRQLYPQYRDVPDLQLSQALYNKYYKDQITFQQFGRSFGLDESLTEEGAVATFADEYSKGVFSGFLNVASGLVGTAAASPVPLAAVQFIPGVQERLLTAKERIISARERFNPTHEGAAAWSGKVLGEAIPFMATSLAGGYAGGAVFGAAGKSVALGQAIGSGGVAFAVEGDSAYEHAKATGATEAQAQAERVIVGSINAYLESLQIRRLIGFHKAGKFSIQGFTRNIRNKAWNMIGGDIRNFTGEILKLALEEGLQEAAQEGVSIGIPAALRGDYPKLEDGSPDYKAILTQIGEAGLGGAFAGTILGGGGAFVSATPSIAAPTTQEMQNTAKVINESKLSDIEKTHLLRQLDENREVFGDSGFKAQTKAEAKQVEPVLDWEGGKNIKSGILKKENHGNGWYTITRQDGTTYKLGKFKIQDATITIREKVGGGAQAIVTYFDGGKEITQALGSVGNIEIALRDAKEFLLGEEGYEGVGLTSEAMPVKFAPEELTVAEQFRNKLDDVVVEIEQMRPVEEAEVSKERARRFEEFRNIKKDVKDPRQRIAIAKQALKGRLKQDITPLQDKFTSEEIDNAFDVITTSTILTEGEQLSAAEGVQKLLFDGVIPAKHELAVMEKAGLLSKDAITEILRNRTKIQKTWDFIKDLSFAPWSLLTSIDLSAGGRQGWKVLFADPKLWARSVARGYRMFASEKYFNYIELKRKTHPLYQEAIRRGIEETSLDSAVRGEEMFASNMIQKIPGIRASARGFIGTVNELRFGWYFKAKELSEGTGMTARHQKELATFANDITGRGKLPKTLQKLQEVGLIFFAPRLAMGLIRTPLDVIPSGKDIKARQYSPARKMLAGTLVKFLAFTLATLYLLDRDDKDKIDVEWNPLSTDFLKVRHGKTRVDITGGYQPILRTIAQLAAGKRKATETGRVYDVERTEIIGRFLQSKLSPHAGLAVDLWRGETFLGEKLSLAPTDVSKQVYERLAPLFIQDVIEAMRYQGLTTTGIIAPLAWHGIGVQTYPTTLTQDTRKLENKLAKQYFGVNWEELGPEAQKALEEYNPQIELMRAEAKIDRHDFDFIGRILGEADKTGRKVTKKLDKNIRSELDKYVLDIGNVGRNIGSGWYLNNKRYKTYQAEMTVLLNKYLTQLITHSSYKLRDNNEKREILQDAIDEIKKEARMRLTTQANYKDLQRREQMK